jgi:CDP-diacylglycerol pyrophosphatase
VWREDIWYISSPGWRRKNELSMSAGIRATIAATHMPCQYAGRRVYVVAKKDKCNMPALAKKAAWIVIACALTAPVMVGRVFADPDAIWKIVHDGCVAEQREHGDPAPCALIDLADGWAVLKDRNGDSQFLLIPTDRVTGIEDPAIRGTHAPNYWEAAWTARRFVEQRLSKTLSSDEIALAINSRWARSQNQLHIHVDCVRPDVHDTLRAVQAQVGAAWSHVVVAGQDYEIRSLSADDLHNRNLFDLVADHLPPGQTLDQETIVLVGTASRNGENGFDLLAGRAGAGGGTGHGEELQDHSCALAKAR